jgi:hypothetical protein
MPPPGKPSKARGWSGRETSVEATTRTYRKPLSKVVWCSQRETPVEATTRSHQETSVQGRVLIPKITSGADSLRPNQRNQPGPGRQTGLRLHDAN